MKTPILSVVIFAYNHENYIKKAIESVLMQKTKYDYILKIVDDCSNDGTRDYIDYYETQYPDKIKKIYNASNIGLNRTFENVVSEINSKYICLLGGDDYWIDDSKIDKEIDILENNNDISCVHTGYQCFNEASQCYDQIFNTWSWHQSNNIEDNIKSFLCDEMSYYPCASTSCIKMDCLKIGFKQYSAFLHSAVGEGTFINMSIILLGKKIYFLPDITTVYTIRQNSLSHYQNSFAEFDYKNSYLKLKILVCDVLKITSNIRNYIISYEMTLLLWYAYKKNMLEYYRRCIAKLNLNNNKVFIYKIVSYLKPIILLYYVLFKLTNKRCIL